jgi:SAM-dependent methyltransferase
MKTSTELYEKLYRDSPSRGQVGVCDFAGTLDDLNMAVYRLGKRITMMAGAHTVFSWIIRNIPAGGRILDLGCGPGNFLAALSDRGYRAFGLDIAAKAVQRLQALGFQVAQGSIEDYPEEWPPELDAVVMIEVLEHLENPVETVQRVRHRFPAATLLITVPSPYFWMARKGRLPSDYPPNHLTRWTPRALEQVLKRVGYTPRIIIPPPSPSEWTGTGIGKFVLRDGPDRVRLNSPQCRVVAALLLSTLKWYLLWPYMKYLHMRGFSAASIVAIGRSEEV